MSGEDPWDPGPVCWNFRTRCNTCGKQRQFAGGRPVEPDCGHPLEAVHIDPDDPDQDFLA